VSGVQPSRPATNGAAPHARRIRAAHVMLAMHVALILFSTIALTTFLVGPPPAWLQTPLAARIYPVAWALTGPSYVVLGALAALAHAAGMFGWRRAVALLVLGCGISLGSELLGTSTGFPFGDYVYTALLGYRIAGLVPFPIPLSWFFMLYCCNALAGRVLPVGDGWRTRLAWAAASGLALTAWDVSLDPAMSHATKHWVWLQSGSFYGMPLVNLAGWWLTGSVVSFAMLAVVPPSAVAARVSPTSFPRWLYAINGVMPVAMCARHGLWWAAVLGALAMTLPLALGARGAPARVRPFARQQIRAAVGGGD
jgi:putative membrane protein